MTARSPVGKAAPSSGGTIPCRQTLDEMLLAAHARNDLDALVELYSLAGDRSEAAGNTDAACFFLTHAYVFGLQCGSAATRDLQLRLWKYGRETEPAG